MLLTILKQYLKTRWDQRVITSQKRLEDYQNRRWKVFKKNVLPHSPFYREYIDKQLEEFPIINKSIMMSEFNSINTVGLNKESALEIALHAEETRDFSPTLNGITVGLSSGTSGQRGLFLVSPKERACWVGVLLAKIFPNSSFYQESIAFFLRANSNLYQSIANSSRLVFHYFDLTESLSSQYQQLMKIQPSILSAPATVLFELAQAKRQGFIDIQPHTIFSVAEVLEPVHQSFIESAFKVKVKQVYQCTEGFLGISNQYGSIQLNEENLIIEKEWIDEYRFIPIVTDLRRTSQPIIRYRLDDVLVRAQQSFSPFTEIRTIEGREGDICLGINRFTENTHPVFSDVIRQVLAKVRVELIDYQINQIEPLSFEIAVLALLSKEERKIIEQNLNSIFVKLNCKIPYWKWKKFERKKFYIKRQRISCQITWQGTRQ